MPLYDFRCEECDKFVEDEFFKIDDDKHIECCGIWMKQAFLKAPSLDGTVGGSGQKWTNDFVDMATGEKTTRTVKHLYKNGTKIF